MGPALRLSFVQGFADDPAVLLYFVLRVHQTHGLADVHLHLQFQQPAVRVDEGPHQAEA